MSSITLIGELTIQKARSFIAQLERKAETTDELFIYIHSHGGCLRAYAEIARAMFRLSNINKSFTGQAVNAGSTALLIFLNCNKRLVTPASSGHIHLPIPNTVVTKEIHKKKVEQIVGFIQRRTGLSKEEVLELNDKSLTSTEMLSKNIATEKVARFNYTEQ